VIERFWWAPGIYPGQTKTVSFRAKELANLSILVSCVILL